MNLAESTWTDADAVDADVALLPVGSTEQHGPHAPLGTDALTAEAIAASGADAYDDEVVIGPTIPVGVAAEHRNFAGTLWVSEDAFRDYVGETVESLAAHGWDRVVVVNGHGGNVASLREVCGRLTRETDLYTVPFTWFDAVSLDRDDYPAAEEPPVDLDAIAMGHGGVIETSLVRAVAPDLVREDRLDDASAGAAAGWGEWHAGVNVAYDSDEFSENGAVGDPSASSAEFGAWLRERAAERLASLLARISERET